MTKYNRLHLFNFRPWSILSALAGGSLFLSAPVFAQALSPGTKSASTLHVFTSGIKLKAESNGLNAAVMTLKSVNRK